MTKSTQHSVLIADDMNYDGKAGELRHRKQKGYADFMAEKLGCAIEVLHVETASDLPISKPIYKEAAKKAARNFEAKARGFHVPASFTTVPGDPVEEVLKASRKRPEPELVVLGTHGRTGLSRLLLGSVAEEVLRHTSTPVMTVGPGAQKNRKGVPSSKSPITLVVATDLGPNSRKAERYALHVARRLRAKVVLVHSLYGSLQPIVQAAMGSPGGTPGLIELFQVLKREASASLRRRKLIFQRAGVRCGTFLMGRDVLPSRAILRLLKSPTTFAVLGTHSRNAVARAFLGSTAREVILNSPSPVITVAS